MLNHSLASPPSLREELHLFLLSVPAWLIWGEFTTQWSAERLPEQALPSWTSGHFYKSISCWKLTYDNMNIITAASLSSSWGIFSKSWNWGKASIINHNQGIRHTAGLGQWSTHSRIQALVAIPHTWNSRCVQRWKLSLGHYFWCYHFCLESRNGSSTSRCFGIHFTLSTHQNLECDGAQSSKAPSWNTDPVS